jgi:serine/threonine protein kinase
LLLTKVGPQKHIAKYLGYSKMNTIAPEIYMRLYDGSLAKLHEDGVIEQRNLVNTVMHHMLQALDFLNFQRLCHRDVKPENILYMQERDAELTFCFVLADFGLSKIALTGMTEVGTDLYEAPEVLLGQKNVTKMDIWSLVVTLMKVDPLLRSPGNTDVSNLKAVHHAVVHSSQAFPTYEQMAQIDPNKRASAKDLLETHFGGRGVYIRRSMRTMARTSYRG